MFAGNTLEVTTFIGKTLSDWMNVLTFALQISRGRVDGEPVNGEIGFEFAQLMRNGQVALDMSQADWAGKKERFAWTTHSTGPGTCSLRRTDKGTDGTVEEHWIAHSWQVPPTLDGKQLRVRDELVNDKSRIKG